MNLLKDIGGFPEAQMMMAQRVHGGSAVAMVMQRYLGCWLTHGCLRVEASLSKVLPFFVSTSLQTRKILKNIDFI